MFKVQSRFGKKDDRMSLLKFPIGSFSAKTRSNLSSFRFRNFSVFNIKSREQTHSTLKIKVAGNIAKKVPLSKRELHCSPNPMWKTYPLISLVFRAIASRIAKIMLH